MTRDEAMAVSKATKLMPSEVCADPEPEEDVGVALGAVEDMVKPKVCEAVMETCEGCGDREIDVTVGNPSSEESLSETLIEFWQLMHHEKNHYRLAPQHSQVTRDSMLNRGQLRRQKNGRESRDWEEVGGKSKMKQRPNDSAAVLGHCLRAKFLSFASVTAAKNAAGDDPISPCPRIDEFVARRVFDLVSAIVSKPWPAPLPIGWGECLDVSLALVVLTCARPRQSAPQQ